MSRAVSLADDGRREPDADLLTEFVAAARGASSFVEAFQRALATLRDRLGATSAVLLEQRLRGIPPARRDSGRTQVRGARCLPDGFLANRLRFYSYPLPFTTGDLDSWMRWARDHYPEHAAEIQTLLDSGARMAVALRAKDEILGMLLLGPPSSGAAVQRRREACCANARSS